MPQLSLHAPVGAVTLSEEDGMIVAVDWGWGRDQAATPVLVSACDQLQDYFDGVRRRFELPIKITGSPYACRVLSLVTDVDYGTTTTYRTLASCSGSAASSIGRILAANPLPILIPGHRVRGYNGKSTPSRRADGWFTNDLLLALETRHRAAVS